jgi:hypothetical protein
VRRALALGGAAALAAVVAFHRPLVTSTPEPSPEHVGAGSGR